MSVCYFLASIPGSDKPGADFPALDAVSRDKERFRSTVAGLGLGEGCGVNSAVERALFLQELDDFLDAADTTDTLLFYFSGHGYVDRDADFHLVCADSYISDRGSILRALKFKDVVDSVRDRRKFQRRVFILDCCFGGAGVGAIAGPDGTKSVDAGIEQDLSAFQAFMKQIDDPHTDDFFISSARANEVAWVKDGQSVFSKYLLDGIDSGTADVGSDGTISYEDLVQYLRRNEDITAAESIRFHPERASPDSRDLHLFRASWLEKQASNKRVLAYYEDLGTSRLLSPAFVKKIERVLESSLHPSTQSAASAELDALVRRGQDKSAFLDEIMDGIRKRETETRALEDERNDAFIEKLKGQLGQVQDTNRKLSTQLEELGRESATRNERQNEQIKLLADERDALNLKLGRITGFFRILITTVVVAIIVFLIWIWSGVKLS